MRAVQLVRRVGPDGLEVRQVPDPVRGGDEVLIEVRAAGVTFPDLLLASGAYQETPELPVTLGGEFAGVVREAPPGSQYSAGDRVVCSSAFRGFAELASVPVGHVLPLTIDVPFEVAACLPANYLTMTFGLLRRGRIRPGDVVLVHGASGGLGTAAVQLAVAFGTEVIAVTSSPDLELTPAGTTTPVHVVPVANFPNAVGELTGGRGVDLVVDPVGGDRLEPSLRCLAPLGRALVLGFTSGTIPSIATDQLAEHNVDLAGVGWGAYLAREPGELLTEWYRLIPLVERGAIRPRLDTVLPLDRAADALRVLENRAACGRLVLTP